MAFLDGSFAPAKRGGQHVGVTKKGKGTKWMLAVDGAGLPLGFHLASSNIAEVKLADRGYDSGTFRATLRCRGICECIPRKRRPSTWRAKRGNPVDTCRDDYRQRSMVERSFAWLGNLRRLLIHWEHLSSIYRSWYTVAVL